MERRAFLCSAACALALPATAARAAVGAASGALAPLVARHPGVGSVPRVALGGFPTPLTREERLGAKLGLGGLWVKHDELAGPGGGKVRKLETLLGEAVALGYGTVATFGGYGSNHALATAHHGRRCGLDVHLYLLAEAPSARTRENQRLLPALGATVHRAGTLADAERRARRLVPARGGSAYVIAAGGSSPLGTLPFVAAALELWDAVQAGVLPPPDKLFVACGTLGVAAGLAVGLALVGAPTEVVAVRASSPGTSSPARLTRLARATQAKLRELDASVPAPGALRVAIDGAELGAGYARPTARARRAIDLARDLSGLSLEPTYTGKAMAALVRAAPSLAGRTVVFWNTAAFGNHRGLSA